MDCFETYANFKQFQIQLQKKVVPVPQNFSSQLAATSDVEMSLPRMKNKISEVICLKIFMRQCVCTVTNGLALLVVGAFKKNSKTDKKSLHVL